MKHTKSAFLFLLFIACSLSLFAQDSLGFTSKAEAENKMVKGKKVGKWVEYLDKDEVPTLGNDSVYAAFYKLVVYKNGIPCGVVRKYLKNGQLATEAPYVHGKMNGMEKVYYKNGNVMWESPETNNKTNGLVKGYYEDGKLKSECTWTDNLPDGMCKEYYESGKLKRQTIYVNGKEGKTTKYDENGNEIR